MYFFTSDKRVLLFVQEADGSEGTVGLHDEDILKIRGIAQADALFGKAAVHFVFHVVDDDDAVGGNPAFDLQQEVRIDLICGKAPDELRLFKIPVLWGNAAQGGMWGTVVKLDIGQEAAPELIQGMEVTDVKGSHPLILHGAEPTLDLGLLCGCIGLVIVDSRADPGGEAFHLPVFVGTAIVEVEQLRTAISGDRGSYDGHEVYEVVIEKDVNAYDEAAGIINERDDEHPALFSIGGAQIRAHAGIPAPDFIDVWTFITAHLAVPGRLHLSGQAF